jgi:hypothetical protein
MITEKLRQYQATGQLIGCYPRPLGGALLVARVLAVSDTEVTFAPVDPEGQPIKEQVVPLSAINWIADIRDYAERLRLIAEIFPTIEQSKGQTTRSVDVIRKRIKAAALTGECVRLTLASDPSQDFKVLRVDREWCELEQYWDHPLIVVEKVVIRYDMINKMQWRTTGQNAVTALWKVKELENRAK